MISWFLMLQNKYLGIFHVWEKSDLRDAMLGRAGI